MKNNKKGSGLIIHCGEKLAKKLKLVFEEFKTIDKINNEKYKRR